MSSQLKTIADFLTPEDAEVARLALQEEGIASFLENATTVGMFSWWGNAVGWVKLQVPEVDADRARAILAQKSVVAAEGDIACVCPECGVDLPPGFEVCWSCETPLGGKEAASLPPNAIVSPTPEDDDEASEVAAPGDEIAWRAFLAAVIGVFVCPPLLTFYSGWLLVRIAIGGQSLSRKGSRSFYWAVVVDLAVCLIVGVCLARLRH